MRSLWCRCLMDHCLDLTVQRQVEHQQNFKKTKGTRGGIQGAAAGGSSRRRNTRKNKVSSGLDVSSQDIPHGISASWTPIHSSPGADSNRPTMEIKILKAFSGQCNLEAVEAKQPRKTGSQNHSKFLGGVFACSWLFD